MECDIFPVGWATGRASGLSVSVSLTYVPIVSNFYSCHCFTLQFFILYFFLSFCIVYCIFLRIKISNKLKVAVVF